MGDASTLWAVRRLEHSLDPRIVFFACIAILAFFGARSVDLRV
jgi:hypothetical protein